MKTRLLRCKSIKQLVERQFPASNVKTFVTWGTSISVTHPVISKTISHTMHHQNNLALCRCWL